MKFRKKPAIVEAVQFHVWDDPIEGVEHRYPDGDEPTKWHGALVVFFLRTRQGEMLVRDGDWIVTGTNGERWVVEAGNFPTYYEPVE